MGRLHVYIETRVPETASALLLLLSALDQTAPSQPPPQPPTRCHIKPDLYKLAPVPLQAYAVVLTNGKQRRREPETQGGEKKRKKKEKRAERQKKKGLKEKERLGLMAYMRT